MPKRTSPEEWAKRLIRVKELIKKETRADDAANELGVTTETWYNWRTKALNAKRGPKPKTLVVGRRATAMGAAPYIVETPAQDKLCIVVGNSREVLQALALMART